MTAFADFPLLDFALVGTAYFFSRLRRMKFWNLLEKKA